jgi:hypothetical protein
MQLILRGNLKDPTQKPLALKETTESDISITNGTGLYLHESDAVVVDKIVMDVMCHGREVLLRDCWNHHSNRHIVIGGIHVSTKIHQVFCAWVNSKDSFFMRKSFL